MGIPVYLSRAEPHRLPQRQFLEALCNHLRHRGLNPQTTGDTHFAMSGLGAVRGLILQSHGLISVAFQRTIVRKGEDRPLVHDSLLSAQRMPLKKGTWLTTPWCHMETAMAYQLGLPILLLVEKNVRLDGILQEGVLAEYPPQFDVDRSVTEVEGYFDHREKWCQLAATWEGEVREVLRTRSRPSPLYGL